MALSWLYKLNDYFSIDNSLGMHVESNGPKQAFSQLLHFKPWFDYPNLILS